MIRIFLMILLSNLIETLKWKCRDKNRLIQDEKDDLYTLVDAILRENVSLNCHYCNEKDDGRPKIWYKIGDISNPQPHEVLVDMANNFTENRVQVSSEHTLTIHNFTENDRGLYYCQRFEGEQIKDKFNYLVDLIYQENSTLETGNLTDWRKYYEEYFVPLNTMFLESQSIEFKYIRDEINLHLEVITQWEHWGNCEVCGRPNNDGIKKKTGFCRIKITQNNSPKNSYNNSDEKFLSNANEIGCRSQVLGRLVPGVSNLSRIIPNFVEIQSCKGTCNPDSEGFNKGWKMGKSAGFKYRKTFVLAANSHLTLICPESTIENKVIWRKNGKVLEAGQSVSPANPEDEPRILVDTFNTLYLVNVQESEEGNYTCQVDDIRMQQIVVFVISKAKILTQAFVRHLMYLGLVLSLTLPCYIAGIGIACSRRKRFKDYQQLKEYEEEKKAGRFLTSD